MLSVAVIGCGAVGLISATVIQREFPNAKVTIVAKDFTPNTTSDVAAGLIEPLSNDDTYPNQDVGKWSSWTLQFLLSLWKQGKAKDVGLSLSPVLQLFEDPYYVTPEYVKRSLGFTELSPDYIKKLSREHKKNYTGGIGYTTFIWEPSTFLPYFQEQFVMNGGKIINKNIATLQEVANFDIIINCTGLGAQKLMNDTKFDPIRGQVARVQAPWQFHTLLVPSHYIITNTNCTILGKIKAKDTEAKVTEKDKKYILEGCNSLVPAMENVKVLRHNAGLRPNRSEIRLQLETLNFNGKEVLVVHNYGHGGNGVTLSYGCAVEVSNLIRVCVAAHKSKL